MNRSFYKLHELADISDVSVEDLLSAAAMGNLVLSVFWDLPVCSTETRQEIECEYINLPPVAARNILVNDQTNHFSPKFKLPFYVSSETAFLPDGQEVKPRLPVVFSNGAPVRPHNQHLINNVFEFDIRGIVAMRDEAIKIIGGKRFITGRKAICRALGLGVNSWTAAKRKIENAGIERRRNDQGSPQLTPEEIVLINSLP